MVCVVHRVCTWTWIICVRIIFTPDHGVEILRHEGRIWSCVWSPEHDGVRYRIPVHLADSLEEDIEVKSYPLESEIYTVVITRLSVTDDLAVTGVTDLVSSHIDLAISVEVNESKVTTAPLCFFAISA